MSTDDFPDGVDRFRNAGRESWGHLWPKLELERRRRTQTDPWFHGEYHFEETVTDRVPDCAVIEGDVPRWIEFVTESEQEYREKTREALRFGFVVHWVFHAAHTEQRGDARDALTPELRGPFTFGEYNPDTGLLDVGDPVTFKNYAFPVESLKEFSRKKLLGYRRGMARIERVGCGYDLGMFAVAGVQRRILANAYSTELCAVAPNQSVDDATWGYPTPDGVKRLIEANDLTRLGPVRRE